jgi:hypothetical protein
MTDIQIWHTPDCESLWAGNEGTLPCTCDYTERLHNAVTRSIGLENLFEESKEFWTHTSGCYEYPGEPCRCGLEKFEEKVKSWYDKRNINKTI